MPKKFRGLYQYDASIDKYRPRGNVDVSTHPGSLILKYKKGADKKQILSLISSLDVLYNNGKLKELFQVLSQLSKLTKVENIVDKRRDAENSGSTVLAQQLYNKDQLEGSFSRGHEEITETNSEAYEGRKRVIQRWRKNRVAITKAREEALKKAEEDRIRALEEVEKNYEKTVKKIEEEYEKGDTDNTNEALRRCKGIKIRNLRNRRDIQLKYGNLRKILNHFGRGKE